MTTTTTDHIKALLVDDGHEFAMIRKTDLAALMQIVKSADEKGRDPWYIYLDSTGSLKREIAFLSERDRVLSKRLIGFSLNAEKHGEERRRYMANNKALLATVEGIQRSLAIERDAHLWADHYLMKAQQDHIETIGLLAKAEAHLLRVARFKRKFPSIAALMDVTP